MRFYILKPNGVHKRYRVNCYTTVHGKRVTMPLTDAVKEAVLAINLRMLDGTITADEAHVQIRELIDTEYRRENVHSMVIRHSALSAANQKVFLDFWAEKYESKYLEDAASARYDFQLAIKLIEPLSLLSGSAAEYSAALRKNAKNVKQQRRAISRLEQIFKFLGRRVVLPKPKPPMERVRHVTQKQFLELLPKLDLEVQDLAMVLYAAALRISEAFALEPSDYRNGTLLVDKQLRMDGTLKAPKREKTGRVVVLKCGREALGRWLEAPKSEHLRHKLKMELKAHNLTPHDLRHSHAIQLLANGAPLKQVANNLRNTQAVCERYYAGFEHTDSTLEALQRFDPDEPDKT